MGQFIVSENKGLVRDPLFGFTNMTANVFQGQIVLTDKVSFIFLESKVENPMKKYFLLKLYFDIIKEKLMLLKMSISSLAYRLGANWWRRNKVNEKDWWKK